MYNKKARLSTRIFIVISLFVFFLSGCQTGQQPIPQLQKEETQKNKEKEICNKLERPEYLSFKQAAFAVAKTENIQIGNIFDFYFFDKKFKSSNYSSIPSLKIDLESKHNALVDVQNYAMNNKSTDIFSIDTQTDSLIQVLSSDFHFLTEGKYRASQIISLIRKSIDFVVPESFSSLYINIDVPSKHSSLELLNIITKEIASVANYDFIIREGYLELINTSALFAVKADFQEPFVEMLERKKMRFVKTGDSFIVKDNFESLLLARQFLKSLNLSEDRFNFCVYSQGENIYGQFNGNEKIVLKGIGKIHLIDYGTVIDGKLKYKLKIKNDKDEGAEEYTVYSQSDTFSVQLNNNAVVKIKLY